MKVIVTDGKKRIVMRTDANEIGFDAPINGSNLMIEAEMNEESPLRIMLGNDRAGVPIVGARLVNRKTIYVAGFVRRVKGHVQHVKGYERRLPPIARRREKHA